MKKNKIYRPTWVEIDLSALRFNYHALKKCTRPGTFMLAAVKADAYGHGAVMVAKTLVKCGVDILGVASTDEAIELRNNNIITPILILGIVCSNEEINQAIKYNIMLTVANLDMAIKINRIAAKSGKKIKVHLKIDTGMGRIGTWHNEAQDFVCLVNKLANIKIEGIYTHLAAADTDKKFTNRQIKDFSGLIADIEKKGVNIELKHAANSIATCSYKTAHFNLVRPGIMLYGMYPAAKFRRYIRLKPVLALKTKVSFIKKVPKNRTISYGATFITKKPTIIATLPIGYADGLRRLLSNKGRVIIRGKFAKICGRICMDQTMVNAGNIKDICLEDEAVIIGQKAGLKITAEEMATCCQTIPYEISCGISKRVPRIYKNN